MADANTEDRQSMHMQSPHQKNDTFLNALIHCEIADNFNFMQTPIITLGLQCSPLDLCQHNRMRPPGLEALSEQVVNIFQRNPACFREEEEDVRYRDDHEGRKEEVDTVSLTN
jgi:predicted protein tyrosine phosphatase